MDVLVDSAGTAAWHSGKPPDPRAVRTARHHGVDISRLRARQIQPEDFERFTHIFALDADNLADVRRLAPPGHGAQLGLLLDLVEGRRGHAVADPYHGDESGFEETWADVRAAAMALIARLAA